MIRTLEDKGGTMALYQELDNHFRMYKRRSISYIIHAHSPEVANVLITVNGKRGSAQKNLVVMYEELLGLWYVYSEGYKYEMGSLGEITSIARRMIQQLGVIVNKI